MLLRKIFTGASKSLLFTNSAFLKHLSFLTAPKPVPLIVFGKEKTFYLQIGAVNGSEEFRLGVSLNFDMQGITSNYSKKQLITVD